MGCSSREEIVEVFNALDGDADRVCELTFDVLTTPERLRTLQRLERGARRQHTPQHALINQLDAQAGEEELGGTLRCALADRLRITKADAGRRIAEAGDLGESAPQPVCAAQVSCQPSSTSQHATTFETVCVPTGSTPLENTTYRGNPDGGERRGTQPNLD
jgi:hypothetical protein